MIYIFC